MTNINDNISLINSLETDETIILTHEYNNDNIIKNDMVLTDKSLYYNTVNDTNYKLYNGYDVLPNNIKSIIITSNMAVYVSDNLDNAYLLVNIPLLTSKKYNLQYDITETSIIKNISDIILFPIFITKIDKNKVIFYKSEKANSTGYDMLEITISSISTEIQQVSFTKFQPKSMRIYPNIIVYLLDENKNILSTYENNTETDYTVILDADKKYTGCILKKIYNNYTIIDPTILTKDLFGIINTTEDDDTEYGVTIVDGEEIDNNKQHNTQINYKQSDIKQTNNIQSDIKQSFNKELDHTKSDINKELNHLQSNIKKSDIKQSFNKELDHTKSYFKKSNHKHNKQVDNNLCPYDLFGFSGITENSYNEHNKPIIKIKDDKNNSSIKLPNKPIIKSDINKPIIKSDVNEKKETNSKCPSPTIIIQFPMFNYKSNDYDEHKTFKQYDYSKDYQAINPIISKDNLNYLDKCNNYDNSKVEGFMELDNKPVLVLFISGTKKYTIAYKNGLHLFQKPNINDRVNNIILQGKDKLVILINNKNNERREFIIDDKPIILCYNDYDSIYVTHKNNNYDVNNLIVFIILLIIVFLFYFKFRKY